MIALMIYRFGQRQFIVTQSPWSNEFHRPASPEPFLHYMNYIKRKVVNKNILRIHGNNVTIVSNYYFLTAIFFFWKFHDTFVYVVSPLFGNFNVEKLKNIWFSYKGRKNDRTVDHFVNGPLSVYYYMWIINQEAYDSTSVHISLYIPL